MVEEQRLKVAFHYGCFAIARRGTKQNKSNVRSSLEVKEIVALGLHGQVGSVHAIPIVCND